MWSDVKGNRNLRRCYSVSGRAVWPDRCVNANLSSTGYSQLYCTIKKHVRSAFQFHGIIWTAWHSLMRHQSERRYIPFTLPWRCFFTVGTPLLLLLLLLFIIIIIINKNIRVRTTMPQRQVGCDGDSKLQRTQINQNSFITLWYFLYLGEPQLWAKYHQYTNTSDLLCW